MKTVYVVMVMDSVPYSEGSWISSIFDSEQKAYEYLYYDGGTGRRGRILLYSQSMGAKVACLAV